MECPYTQGVFQGNMSKELFTLKAHHDFFLKRERVDQGVECKNIY